MPQTLMLGNPKDYKLPRSSQDFKDNSRIFGNISSIMVMLMGQKKQRFGTKLPDGHNIVLCVISRVRVLGQGMMKATASGKCSSIALPSAPFSAAASAINFGFSLELGIICLTMC